MPLNGYSVFPATKHGDDTHLGMHGNTAYVSYMNKVRGTKICCHTSLGTEIKGKGIDLNSFYRLMLLPTFG